MITLGSKKNSLRSSQPTLKQLPAITNENAVRPKIFLQQLGASKKPQIRAFGRNITNLPLANKKQPASNNVPITKLKQDLKIELAKMRQPAGENMIQPMEIIQPVAEAELVPAAEPMVLEKPLFAEPVAPVTSNPQACEEYVSEIDVYLRAIEGQFMVNPQYMERQPDINEKMRAILVDWLVDVHIRFKLLPETLFLTVNIIDRYLEKERVARDRLQLLGVTAMLIASKYEEIYPPEVKDFAYITDHAYTKDEILTMEQKVLHTLEFNLNVPSSQRFLQRFCAVSAADPKTVNLGKYFIELALTEIGMLKYPPSMVAAGGLYAALKIQGNEVGWDTVAHKVGYDKHQLAECVKDITVIGQMVGKVSLQAVKKKYSSTNYTEVAKIKF